MIKKLVVLIIACLYSFTSLYSVDLDLPTDTELETYYKWWKNGRKDFGASGSPLDKMDVEGYVTEFLLPEDVKIGEFENGSTTGAVVRMIPNGTASEMAPGLEMPISTDEAMGYGMLLAVMNDDQELFNKFLRVVEYYKVPDTVWNVNKAKNKMIEENTVCKNLTSWIIPCEKEDYTWESDEAYKNFDDTENKWKKLGDDDALGDWIGTKPSQLRANKKNGWLIDEIAKRNSKGQIIGQKRRLSDGKWTVSGIAMDGALDIAFALFMANHKWNILIKDDNNPKKKLAVKINYAWKARKRFSNISAIVDKYGVHKNNGRNEYFLPTGNHKYAYDNDASSSKQEYIERDLTRPCDWMLSHFRSFYLATGDQQSRQLLGSIQSQMEHLDDRNNGTGLMPDFCEYEDKTSGLQELMETYTKYPHGDKAGEFLANETDADHWYMNSARYPARMALDYLMYGDEYSLSKAKDILDFTIPRVQAMTKKPSESNDDFVYRKTIEFFHPNRLITGEAKADYSNQVLKSAFLVAMYALDKSGDETYNAVFNEYFGKHGWFAKFTNEFNSCNPDYWQILKYKDASGTEITYHADLRRDPGHTGYFEDTWTLLGLCALKGKWVAPDFYYDDLADAGTTWSISKGSGHVSIDQSTPGTIKITVDSVPSSNDIFAITLKAEGFDALARSGFSFDYVINRSTDVESEIDAKLSYPGLDKSVAQPLRERIPYSRTEPMHKMGYFDGQSKVADGEHNAVLEIGLNSNLTDGTIITLSNLHLFDPPGETERYLYVGQWKSDRTYNKGDYVRYKFETYKCIADISETGKEYNPLDNPGSWEVSDYGKLGTKWETNTYYFTGELVHYNGRTYMCKQSFTSINCPPLVSSFWLPYWSGNYETELNDWVDNYYFIPGDYVIYQGNAYKCLTAHKSISSWNPVSAFTLWEKCNSIIVVREPADWETWTAYATDSYAMYNGKKYKCLVGHTSQPGWEPTSVPALWVAQ